jgi:hypothetical protein
MLKFQIIDKHDKIGKEYSVWAHDKIKNVHHLLLKIHKNRADDLKKNDPVTYSNLMNAIEEVGTASSLLLHAKSSWGRSKLPTWTLKEEMDRGEIDGLLKEDGAD